MGKRGDKRRLRLRRRTPHKPGIEGFQIGPMTMERHGKVLVSHLDASHPDFAPFQEARSEWLAGLPRQLSDLRARLLDLFAPFDAFDVVVSLWLRNVPKDVETYRESTEPGLLALPELAAAILLERPSRHGSRKAARPDLFHTEESQEVLTEFLRAQAFQYLHDSEKAHPGDPAYGQIRGEVRAHRLAVRGPSYPWQEHAIVVELLGAEGMRDLVEHLLGFSAGDALALVEATTDVGLDRLAERVGEARRFSDRVLVDDARARDGKPVLHPEHQAIVTTLGQLGRSVAAKRIHHLGIAWASLGSGTTMQFSASDLAEKAGTTESAAAAFLDLFSVTFGQFSDRDRLPDIEDLRERPLLRDANGHHICVSPHNLLWALRGAMEERLRGASPRGFQRYQKHRARVIERKAVGMLAGALDADWSHAGLRYETESGSSKRTAELDGIVRRDTALFLIEVKAAGMRPPARRGAPDALRSWLETELGGAAEQARRAKEALLGPVRSRVFDESRRVVDLDLEGIRHVFEVIVTLEDLPALAPQSWKLADAGVLPSAPVPWVVSLNELEVICDVVERPAELVHFVLRRQRLNEQRSAWAVDELDYFMHYLLSGLYWPDERDDAVGPTQLLSFTDQLDDYYLFRRGERRRRARRPSQKHHRDVRSLLDCLGVLRAPGALEASLAILDIASPWRKRIAGDLRRLRMESAQDAADHDRTHVFGNLGITILSVPTVARTRLADDLRNYCTLKKYQHKAERWVGFGVFAGPPEPVQVAVVFTDPWEADPALDDLVATLPTFGLDGSFDGRSTAREARRKHRASGSRRGSGRRASETSGVDFPGRGE